MKTLFLLITLTQNGAGDINASFVNTQTLQQCQQKMLMVESVFETASIPVIESHCLESQQEFSEFDHASSASKIRYFYLITFDQESVKVLTMPDWHNCMQRQRSSALVSGGQPSRVYCSSSIQSIL